MHPMNDYKNKTEKSIILRVWHEKNGGGCMNENAIHGAPKRVKNGELH